MTTLKELVEQQAFLNATMEDAVAAMLEELASWTSLSPAAAQREANELMPLLVEQFGSEAALTAADFYDDQRAKIVTAAGLSYAAQLAPSLPDEIVQEQIGWALAVLKSDLVDTNLESAYADALSKMGNTLQLLVGGQYRDTIGLSAGEDPLTGVRYARHASANACAFCRLMATRGAAYLSEESALVVVGEVDPADISRRIRGPRGSRGEGEKYHDNCRCTAVAVFPGDTLDEAPYVDQWRADYAAAAAAAGGSTRADLKEILSHMRENTGAR